MKPKIGILGLGSIGSRHLKNFKSLGCETKFYDPAACNEGSRDYLINWADAIVIASPTAQHHLDIATCFNAKKPCFVEKPIANLYPFSVANVLMVGYNLRFHSCVKKAREWLGSGRIGKPLWARFTCAQYNDKPAYLRDGVILNWSHEIDLAIYLLGSAEVVGANTRTHFRLGTADSNINVYHSDDIADIILIHKNIGSQTSVHLDYVTRWERRGFIIVGDDGSLECDLVTRQIFRRDNEGRLTDTFCGRDSFDSNYIAEAQAFLDRLKGKETLGCTAEEAMNVVNICLIAKEKASGN